MGERTKRKRSLLDRFTNATLAAAIAEDPSIATSVGLQVSPNNIVTQDARAFEEGSPEEKLRESLASIAASSPTYWENAIFEMAPYAFRAGLGVAGKAGLKAARDRYTAMAFRDAINDANLNYIPKNLVNPIEYTKRRLSDGPKKSIPFLQASKISPSGKIISPINELPSEQKVIKLGDKEYNDNYAFIRKFNKWNKRYRSMSEPEAYKPLSYSLANNSEALDEAIKNRLKEHNTFIIGKQLNKEDPAYKDLYNTVQKQHLFDYVEPYKGPAPKDFDEAMAIESAILKDAEEKVKSYKPSNEELTNYLITHYIENTSGYAGRSGVNNVPIYGESGNTGTIYVSNNINNAVGYATRYKFPYNYGQVSIVRRPIDFKGSRENWVMQAEFPLHTRGYNQRGISYYTHELPYLMKYGISPKQSITTFDKDLYKTLKRDLYKDLSELKYDFEIRLDDYARLGFDVKDFGLGYGSPYQKARSKVIDDIIYRMNKTNSDRAYVEASRQIPQDLEGDEISQINSFINKAMLENELTKKYNAESSKRLGLIVNSKKFKNRVSEVQKDMYSTQLKRINKASIHIPGQEEIDKFVEKSGVKPLKFKGNIGSSELAKTIGKTPEDFQHFIFVGQPGEQGLEIVKTLPYDYWKDIPGWTAHRGNYTPGLGLSRKAKSHGGKFTIDY